MTSQKELNTVARKLEAVVKVLAGLLMFSLVLITVVDVIGRKFGHPFAFAFEFTKVAVAFMFYVTLPLVVLRRENVVVDLVPTLSNKLLAAVVEAGVNLLCIGILAIGTVQLWQYGITLERFNTVMMFTRWPIAPMVYFMSVMMGITTIVLVLTSIRDFRGAFATINFQDT